MEFFKFKWWKLILTIVLIVVFYFLAGLFTYECMGDPSLGYEPGFFDCFTGLSWVFFILAVLTLIYLISIILVSLVNNKK